MKLFINLELVGTKKVMISKIPQGRLPIEIELRWFRLTPTYEITSQGLRLFERAHRRGRRGDEGDQLIGESA